MSMRSHTRRRARRHARSLHLPWRRSLRGGAARCAGTAGLATALLLAAGIPAQAAEPYKEITGPLWFTSIVVGNQLGCQIGFRGDTLSNMYPSNVKPGDCGTLLTTGTQLFAPNFASHGITAANGIGTYTPWTPVSQTPVTGAGTAANPYVVTTVVNAGSTGLQVTQVDTYDTNQEYYTTDTTIVNTSGTTKSGVLYRAGDCYLHGNDNGYGFVATGVNAGCSVTPSNSPATRFMWWGPATAGFPTPSQYMEGLYSDVWRRIGTHLSFQNTVRPNDNIDNGAGISWPFSLKGDGQATYSSKFFMDPVPGARTGLRAARRPVSRHAIGERAIVAAPSNRGCYRGRRLRLVVNRKFRPALVGVEVKLPGRTKVLGKLGWSMSVGMRGRARGRFPVTVSARTVTGRTVSATRRYRIC